MKTTVALTDKVAIGLSMVCTLHCLALPMLLVVLPSAVALPLDNEAFHLWMIIAVIPTSVYALTLGCRQHKRYRLLILGITGLAMLITALLLEGTGIGEVSEKPLTVLGAALIAIGHGFNYRLCHQHKQASCDCDDEKNLVS